MLSPEPVLQDDRTEEAARPPATPSKAQATALVAVLAALTAVAPLAVDMYVPAFPAMGVSLGASSAAVQLTMTAFLAGLVVGQLIIGPLSDGLGRRKLLISGTVAFTLFSVLCALAPSVELLTAARFLQGLAGAAGMVLARAVLTDRFHGPDLPRRFALLSQIMGVAPVAAPVLGGAVLSVGTWRLVFGVLTFIGALLLVAVLVKVPESLPAERRSRGGLGGTFRAMGALLGARAFMGQALVLGFISAALFSYIGGSSFVFQELHGVSPTVYAAIFTVNALGILAAGAVFGKLSRRLRINSLLAAGVCLTGLGTVLQVLLVVTVGETLAGTWGSLFLAAAGIGLIIPATMTLGQSLGHKAPGAASAVLGGFQFLLGAVATPLGGLFGEGSSMPMAVIMLVSAALAGCALLVLVRPWRGEGDIPQAGSRA